MRSIPSARRELDPLIDSLCGAIRWRRADYGAILRAELELLVAMSSEEWLEGPAAAAASANSCGLLSPARGASPDRGG